MTLMDKKRGQGSGNNTFLVGTIQRIPFPLFLSSVLCVLTAGGLCPVTESNLNHFQSLASGDCGIGGVTDRQQLGQRPVSTVGLWGMGVPQIPPGRDCS